MTHEQILTPGVHRCRCECSDGSPKSSVRPIDRSGFTIIELVVCVGIIAVLLALLLPAIQYARETARRTHCRNNFRQFGIALTNYVDLVRSYPPSETTPWPVAIAPQLERGDLFERFDHRFDAFSSAMNAKLGEEPFPLAHCPTDRREALQTSNWMISSVSFNDDLRGLGLQTVTDGLSRTALLTEVTVTQGLVWITGPEQFCGINDSAHAGVFHLLYCDGSVPAVNKQIDQTILAALATPNRGETVQTP